MELVGETRDKAADELIAVPVDAPLQAGHAAE
jgi:hypothetical protein